MYRAMIEKWILPLRAFYKCSPLHPNAEGRHQENFILSAMRFPLYFIVTVG
jgi:hypothetical protein